MSTLLTTLGLMMAALAAGDMNTHPAGSANSPIVYWPLAYSSGIGDKKTREMAWLDDFLKGYGLKEGIRITPLRRGLHLYRDDPGACVVFSTKRIRQGELISRPFGNSDHWFYVRKSAGFKSRAEIKSAATLEGAERYVVPETLMPVVWRYAPTYEALIAMLENGRVDAVTLGPLVDEGIVPLPDDVVRLDDMPFARLHATLHCWPGPETKRLIMALDAAVDAEKAGAP